MNQNQICNEASHVQQSKQEYLRHLNIEEMSRQVFYWPKEKQFI